jgi:putative salt-induced outer membrane protein YdiY
MKCVCVMAALAAGVAFGQEGAPQTGETPAELKVESADPGSFFAGWNGSVEVGLNGSTGNTETTNLRAGVKGERKTDLRVTTASLLYTWAQENSENTKNRLEAGARNDWIFAKESRWRYYLAGTYEYDQFQDWTQRVTGTNGVGYAFIQSDKTLLLGRAGVGAYKEFGGSDNRVHPEGNLGVDLEYKISERQKLTFSADYYPDFLELTNYRATAKGAWEVLVDEEMKMSLKVGFEDRYDPTPNGNKRNDLDYFAMLVWGF